MSRLARAAAATLLTAVTAVTVVTRSVPAGAAGMSSWPASVHLLAQTPTVRSTGTWQARLDVVAPDPVSDRVEIMVFGQLVDRSDFDSALKGRVNGYSSYHPSVPVAQLAADPAGGADVTVPVDRAPAAGEPLPPLTLSSGSGVYPVQVVVTDGRGAALSAPLTTFLVYSNGGGDNGGGDNGGGTFPPLAATLVVPFGAALAATPAGRVEAPGPGEEQRLNRLAAVLAADSTVPLSVLADPLTLSALEEGAAAGSATDRATLATLGGVAKGGLIEILPAPYGPVRLGDLVSAHLPAEATQQLTAGTEELKTVFGVVPSGHSWVGGLLDPTSAGVLAPAGVTSVVMPDAALTPLPYPPATTFAERTALGVGPYRFSVLAADSGITADFARTDSPVLDAYQLLGELAMIQTETPGVKGRGVVAIPPATWSADPAEIATLIAGLGSDPLLEPVTVGDAFSRVSVAKGDPLRFVASGQQAVNDEAVLAADSTTIAAARQMVDGLGALFPTGPEQVTNLPTELLVAESSLLDDGQRAALLHSITTTAARMTRQISLPAATSITLTASRGQLPITILTSSPLRPQVQLTLTSQRLIFRGFQPPGGNCSVPTPTKEVCTFTLAGQNTTLHVPVETRSTGVFPLAVYVYAPGTSVLLAYEKDTVRSTAVSGVGVVLIVVAGLSLALWWGRDLRRGRRPRSMIRSPLSDPAGDGCHHSDRDPVESEVADNSGRM